jgi:hypothetical protein
VATANGKKMKKDKKDRKNKKHDSKKGAMKTEGYDQQHKFEVMIKKGTQHKKIKKARKMGPRPKPWLVL